MRGSSRFLFWVLCGLPVFAPLLMAADAPVAATRPFVVPIDVSRLYLRWTPVPPDPARATFRTDPTADWSEQAVLSMTAPLRNTPLPFVRFSVPVPVDPGTTIQSAPLLSDEISVPTPAQLRR